MRFMFAVGLVVAQSQCAVGAITSFATPAALEGFVGGPLMIVPDDGLPVGTLYGPGLPLATPLGPMSFAPLHEKVAPGAYHPIAFAPLAGSDVIAPAGTIAIDFLFTPLMPGAFAFGAIGSVTASTPVVTPVLAPGVPVYVGFGATGESISMVTISTVPFGSTPPLTWEVSAIRVIPGVPTGLVLGGALVVSGRRRR